MKCSSDSYIKDKSFTIRTNEGVEVVSMRPIMNKIDQCINIEDNPFVSGITDEYRSAPCKISDFTACSTYNEEEEDIIAGLNYFSKIDYMIYYISKTGLSASIIAISSSDYNQKGTIFEVEHDYLRFLTNGYPSYSKLNYHSVKHNSSKSSHSSKSSKCELGHEDYEIYEIRHRWLFHNDTNNLDHTISNQHELNHIYNYLRYTTDRLSHMFSVDYNMELLNLNASIETSLAVKKVGVIANGAYICYPIEHQVPYMYLTAMLRVDNRHNCTYEQLEYNSFYKKMRRMLIYNNSDHLVIRHDHDRTIEINYDRSKDVLASMRYINYCYQKRINPSYFIDINDSFNDYFEGKIKKCFNCLLNNHVHYVHEHKNVMHMVYDRLGLCVSNCLGPCTSFYTRILHYKRVFLDNGMRTIEDSPCKLWNSRPKLSVTYMVNDPVLSLPEANTVSPDLHNLYNQDIATEYFSVLAARDKQPSIYSPMPCAFSSAFNIRFVIKGLYYRQVCCWRKDIDLYNYSKIKLSDSDSDYTSMDMALTEFTLSSKINLTDSTDDESFLINGLNISNCVLDKYRSADIYLLDQITILYQYYIGVDEFSSKQREKLEAVKRHAKKSNNNLIEYPNETNKNLMTYARNSFVDNPDSKINVDSDEMLLKAIESRSRCVFLIDNLLYNLNNLLLQSIGYTPHKLVLHKV